MTVPKTQKQYRLPPPDQCVSLDSLGTPKEVAVPAPKANELLIKIVAVSLNYRDIIIADNRGRYPGTVKEDGVVPTSDIAGAVVGLGSDVSGDKWKEGDRVVINFNLEHVDGDADPEKVAQSLGGRRDGGLQEYIAVPAYAVIKIPDFMSYEQASTLPCAAVTAYNALYGPGGHPLQAGDTVLLQGTGGVSIFGLQIAKAAGATAIVTSSSDEKLQLAKKLGADHLVNYKKTPDWAKEVLKLTNGRGAQHIVEVGGPGTMKQSLEAVAWAGTISSIGFVASSDEPFPNVALLTLVKGSVLRGIQIGSVRQFEALIRLITANQDKFVPVVDRVFPFDQALDAYRYLESQKHVGKVVIQVAA